MKNDNISRQAALAYPLSWEHYDKEHGDRKFICGVESYREYIEHLPSTDRKGHWEMKTDPYGFFEEIPVCSECGNTTEMRKTYNFCPECGADMRGEDE